MEVLKGAAFILGRQKPHLLIECETRHIDFPIQNVFNHLKELGYAGYFYHQGKQLTISRFNLELHQRQEGDRFWTLSDYVNNFFFVHRDI